MRLHKHSRMILAILTVLCVMVTVVLHAQGPTNVPAQPPSQPKDQAATAGTTAQPAESPAISTAAPADENPTPADPVPADSAPAVPDTTVTQSSESTQANDPAADVPATASVPASTAAASTEKSAATEDLQRQMADQVKAAISPVEKPKVSPDAAYEPGVVLVTVREGTTAAQVSRAMSDAGVKTVDHNDVEAVTSDLMKAKLAPNATIDDAIYELESTGVARAAQPNYLYEIAEELTSVANDTEFKRESATTGVSAKVEVAGPPAPAASEPTPEADSAEVQPDNQSAAQLAVQSEDQPATSTQSTTPTSVRDALNDTYASRQWGLDSIDALAAWEDPALKNATTTVGVGIVDNGFGDTHEDLADNVRSTYSVATKLENVPVTPPPGTPNANHGSHVAGIVGATSNNQKGISGVGFNHIKLSLVNITRASDPASISTSDVVEGFDYLIKHKDQYNIRVANMSVGGRTGSLPDAKDDAILKKIDEAYDKGIVTVASAGNRTAQYDVPYINYPSEYATLVSVMNLRNKDSADPKSVELSRSSNYNADGMDGKDIAAPGTDIYSTYPTGYGNMSGTSMAAPHVAGVMGLMFTVNPQLSPAQAKDKLYSSARDLGDTKYGHGEVNAAAAVRAAAGAVIEGPEYLAVGSTTVYSVTPDSAGWIFSSTNPSILAIGENGAATAVSSGKATVSANNGTATILREVTVLGPITGNMLVAEEGFGMLSVTVPEGCGDLAWTWSSSNEDVAKVANSGTVYGKSAGTATITATLVSNANVQLNYAVTVYKAIQGAVYLPVNGTADLIPAAQGDAIWSSKNDQVATVDQNGKVTAVHAGGAVVSCTIGSGDNTVTYLWPVYVYGPIEGATSVGVGQSTQLNVAGIENVSQDLQTGWTWSLDEGSSPEVATVSDKGVVTGNKLGMVTVTAKRGDGSSQVSFSHTVNVTALSIADAKVTIPKQTYSGKNLSPVLEVTINGTALTAGVDYEVDEQNIVNVGSYDVVIRGKGNYSGTVTGIFMVEPKRLTPPKPVTGLVYNGKEQTGIPAGEGYNLRGRAKETDAGEYMATAVVTDQVNTCWNDNDPYYDIDWKIEECPISNVTVSGLGTYVFNGSAYTPKPTVTLGDMTLTEGTDYTLSYANNVNAGTATVTLLTGENVENFKGTKQATFTIVPASLSSASVTGLSTQTYTGKFLTPKPTVTLAGKTLHEGTDYTLTYKNNLEVGTATVTVTGKGNYAGTKTATFKIVYPSCNVAYRTHVQDDGWQDWVRNGAMSGTSGRSLRLEGVNLKLEGQPFAGSIEYRTHVENIGWESSWTRDGALSGTTGRSLRLEAIQIRLTGEMAERYDVWYRVHAQDFGWMGWAKNGERAGTATYGYRLEALEVVLQRKGSVAPGSTVDAYRQQVIGYSTHVQNIGWQEQVADGDTSGTFGQSLRLEGIKIGLQEKPYAGSIEYRTHVQDLGWESSWARDGALSGTTGRSLRLEAIQIRLTGEMAEHYDVWYRVHVQGIGWMDWVKNGESSGTTGRALRLEAIKIKLVPRA